MKIVPHDRLIEHQLSLLGVSPPASPHPTFQILDTEAGNLPSVANLPAALTINSVTQYPDLRYNGQDATVSSFPPWTYGETLSIAGAGITYNQGSPLLGSLDDSVGFSGGTGRYGTSTASVYDITTEDIVIEAVIYISINGTIIGKLTAAPKGYQLWLSATYTLRMLIDDDVIQSHVISGALTVGTWNHVMVFFDRSGFGQWYVNGVASGAAVDISNSAGSLSNSAGFAISSNSYAASVDPFGGNVAYLAMYKYPAWLDTHLQATVAKERFTRLLGLYPQRCVGTAVPEVLTRASASYLDKIESGGETKLYYVGDNWLRVCDREDKNGERVAGYLAETQVQNKCLQSQAFATTWTKLDAGDTITNNNTTSPLDSSTASTLVGDATDGDHGVSQAVTVTAATWTFSVWAKKGNKNWLYLSDDTVANCTAYYDLDSGVIGTKGAGFASIDIKDDGDDWYRCWGTFTGTAAAHTFKIQTADSDGDKSIQGNGATVNTNLFGAQIELGSTPSSYIPTTVAAVTRSPNLLRYKGNDGNVRNNQRGTLITDVLLPDYDQPVFGQYIVSLNDGSSANDMVSIYTDNDRTTAPMRATGEAGGNVTVASATLDVANGIVHSVRTTWKTNMLQLYVDSFQATPDTTCGAPDDLDQIEVGAYPTSNIQLNGLIRNLRIYKSYGVK